MVAIIEQLGEAWRQVADQACLKDALSEYEQFCVAFAAGCPVRLTPQSTISTMEWECAPHFMEKEEDGWKVYWRQFDE